MSDTDPKWPRITLSTTDETTDTSIKYIRMSRKLRNEDSTKMDTNHEKQLNELRRHLIALRDDCDHSKSALTRLRLDVETRIDIIDVRMRALGIRPPTDSKPTVPDGYATADGTDEEIANELSTYLIGLPNTRRDNILRLVRRQIDEIVAYMKNVQK